LILPSLVGSSSGLAFTCGIFSDFDFTDYDPSSLDWWFKMGYDLSSLTLDRPIRTYEPMFLTQNFPLYRFPLSKLGHSI